MTVQNLKLRVAVRFPATVQASGGIKVVKAGGVYTVSPAFDQLSTLAASEVTDPSLKKVWIWDSNTDTYNTLTLTGLGDALFKLTSTTSLSIATGSTVFTTQANKDVAVGQFVLATSDADTTNYMFGQITAYSSTSLTVNVTATGGSGTHADWTIRPSGPRGETGATGQQGATGAAGVSKSQIYGLTLSNNASDATNDIDIATGEAASNETTTSLIELTSGLTKQLDAAWASGTNAGGRFDSAISDGTWHTFLISDGTNVDVGFSKSLDPTGQTNYPSGYTHYRRIGSIVRVSSAIKAFVQVGDIFMWSAPVADANGSGSGYDLNPGISAVLKSLTVPTGISVEAIGSLLLYDPTADDSTTLTISSPLIPAAAADLTNHTIFIPPMSGGGVQSGVAPYNVITNTSGQLRYRLDKSQTDTRVFISTKGWRDFF